MIKSLGTVGRKDEAQTTLPHRVNVRLIQTDRFAANLWELRRQPPDLLGRGLRPFRSSPTSRSSDDRPKRAPGAALPKNSAKHLVQTQGPAGQVPSRTVLYCSDPMLHATRRMPCMPHALHEMPIDGSLRRFTSWVSTRHCSGLERRTGTATRTKHCCILCLAGCMVRVACCMSHVSRCGSSTLTQSE